MLKRIDKAHKARSEAEYFARQDALFNYNGNKLSPVAKVIWSVIGIIVVLLWMAISTPM